MMVEVFHATETQEYTYAPEIFGCYIKSSETVNGRNYYTSVRWIFTGLDDWKYRKYWNFAWFWI